MRDARQVVPKTPAVHTRQYRIFVSWLTLLSFAVTCATHDCRESEKPLRPSLALQMSREAVYAICCRTHCNILGVNIPQRHSKSHRDQHQLNKKSFVGSLLVRYSWRLSTLAVEKLGLAHSF